MREMASGFSYSTCHVNKNFNGMPHVDKNNVGLSWALSLGDFEGGEWPMHAERGGEPLRRFRSCRRSWWDVCTLWARPPEVWWKCPNVFRGVERVWFKTRLAICTGDPSTAMLPVVRALLAVARKSTWPYKLRVADHHIALVGDDLCSWGCVCSTPGNRIEEVGAIRKGHRQRGRGGAVVAQAR
jgi:hypothetical protein